MQISEILTNQQKIVEIKRSSKSERQASFLALQNLQTKIPPGLFIEITQKIDQSDDLPQRVAFDGSTKNCSFQELQVNSHQLPSSSLSVLLKNQDSLTRKIYNFSDKKNSSKLLRNPVKAALKKSKFAHFLNNSSSLPYILNFKNRSALVKQLSYKTQVRTKEELFRDKVVNQDSQMYQRMKTVFGHAIIPEGSASAVYNCKFDLQDKFIITGADDGIIKVWSKDTLVLQASLHGHMDVIIDIAISKCNRYMASGSKDGTLIIWDMQKCKMIKRIGDAHTKQVNKIEFVMIQCSHKNTQKNMANLQQPGSANKQHHSLLTAELRQFEPMTSFPQTHNDQVLQQTYDQFLMTCSDDGSICIYDVSSFSKNTTDEFYTKGVNNSDRIYTPNSKFLQNEQLQRLDMAKNEISKEIFKGTKPEDKISRRTRKRGLVSNTNPTTANSSSQSQSQECEIYMERVRPEDFRQGSRNKHIDYFSVNSRGYLAGGTNHGEVYLWKVNFAGIRKKSDTSVHWINSFKLHKKAAHNILFSPCGNMLLTGSADGTSCIWNTSFVEKNAKPINVEEEHQLNPKNIEISEYQLIHRFEESKISESTECLIDGIEWSCKGRYAYAAISVKEKIEGQEQQEPGKVKIKVYDTYSGETIQSLDLACRMKKEFTNYSSVLKAHPTQEDVILSCYDGGSTVLYNTKKRKVVQQIDEYGIYSIEQFTMNNAIDVDFSSDGQYLALSSLYGTLTLYSTESYKQALYEGTRVQQFFNFDNQMHEDSPYEKLTCQPQLCGFELNPYEQQPLGPVIGPYQRTDETFEDSERQQLFAREFAREEEKFYQDQLKDGLRLGYFNPLVSAPAVDGQRSSALPQREQRLISSNIAAALIDADMHEGSDQELIQGPSQRPLRSGRRLIGVEDQPEDVEQSECPSDEEFKDENSGSEEPGEDEEAEDEGYVSEYAGSKRIHATTRDVPYWDQSRQNYHQFDLANSDEESKVPERSRRRNGARNLTQSQESLRGGRERQSRRRLRQVVHSGETSQFIEAPDDMSNFGPPANRRNIVMDSESESEAPARRRSSRNRAESNDRMARRNRRQQEPEVRRPGLRNGNRRVRGDSSVQIQESEMEFSEAASNKVQTPKSFDEQFEKQITQGLPNQRDDTYSQRGSKKKKGVVIMKEGRMSTSKTDDESYTLGTDQSDMASSKCHFCKRGMDSYQFIGPFSKKRDKLEILQITEDQQQERLYFHQKCLEANNYVKYDKQRQIWVNIDTAIKNLVEKKQFTCYRCLLPGATVQCKHCDRAFHGHYCQNQYLLPTNETETIFLCLFCRNQQNFDVFKCDADKSFNEFRMKELDTIRKAIDKEYLFEVNPGEFYVPQLRDEVMYFFQGHEKFVQSNNCFFYSGNQRSLGSTDLPWMKQPSLKNIPKGQLHCLVVNVTHKFANSQASKLVQQFGNCSSDIVQVEKIVTHVELQVIEPGLRLHNFIIQIFPSEATEYIIPIQVFNHKYGLFQKHYCAGTLIGKRFKTYRANQLFSGHDIKVHDVKPLEQEYCSESFWESIVVTEVDTQSMMRGRRGNNNDHFDPATADKINFWDIIYPEETEKSIGKLVQELTPKAFEDQENKRVIDGLELFILKKSDQCFFFKDRVSNEVADYRSFVSAEMWLQLILDRLKSRYYRSHDQLWFDFDLIIHCSMTYNGVGEDLTVAAEALVDKIRKELRNYINTNHETKTRSAYQQPLSINKEKKGGPQLGFDEGVVSQNNTISLPLDDDLPKRKTRARFGQNAAIGNGGASVKDMLNETLHQETNLQVQQDSKIVIDFSEGLSSNLASKNSPGHLLTRRTKATSKLDPISANGMFTVDYSEGIITIDQSFGNSGKRSTRQLGKKRKRMEDSESEDFGSNVENSMNHNLERRSKRQRV